MLKRQKQGAGAWLSGQKSFIGHPGGLFWVVLGVKQAFQAE
jgi:hypothetical protein